MDWLLEEACRLEEQVATLRQEIRQLKEIIEEQDEELREVWSELTSLRRCIEGANNPLGGRKVAVIGPSFRKQAYQGLVEGLEGRFLFAPSDEKLSLIDRMMAKADGVVFITTYTSHVAQQHVKLAEARYQVPVVLVNTRGLKTLQEAILGTLIPMMEYQESA